MPQAVARQVACLDVAKNMASITGQLRRTTRPPAPQSILLRSFLIGGAVRPPVRDTAGLSRSSGTGHPPPQSETRQLRIRHARLRAIPARDTLVRQVDSGAGSMHRHIRTLGLVIALAASAACRPKIERFAVVPRRLCAGQTTTVAWQVKGRATLSADPALPDTGAVPSSGSRRFTPRARPPADTTTFELTARRHGRSVFARQGVVVFATGVDRPIVIATKPAGADSLVAIDSLRAAVWDDAIRIDDVSSESDRTLRVIHDGRMVDLPADGTPSAALRGSRVSGRWEVRAALQPGEQMGSRQHPPPDRLRLRVRLSCGS